MTKKEFVIACQIYLDSRWAEVSAQIQAGSFKLPKLSQQLQDYIYSALTSNTQTYRYVLPTQLLAKAVDSSIDCRSIQAGSGLEGAFDARTIAHKVIVPFDRSNNKVLGGSTSPYISNPLRCPAVTSEYRSNQKNKKGWDELVHVLEEVQSSENEKVLSDVFDVVLFHIYGLLDNAIVTYPAPSRVSLQKTIELVQRFLSGKSGGNNEEAIAAALLKTLSERFSIYERIQTSNVNASDISSGMAADIECFINEKVALLVEVKDQKLTLTHIEAKLENARAKSITEILFLAQQGIEVKETTNIVRTIGQEFVSGHNIYHCNIIDFAMGIFILLGEKGRVQFLTEVGKELDSKGSAIQHKKNWAQLLRQA